MPTQQTPSPKAAVIAAWLAAVVTLISAVIAAENRFVHIDQYHNDISRIDQKIDGEVKRLAADHDSDIARIEGTLNRILDILLNQREANGRKPKGRPGSNLLGPGYMEGGTGGVSGSEISRGVYSHDTGSSSGADGTRCTQCHHQTVAVLQPDGPTRSTTHQVALVQ